MATKQDRCLRIEQLLEEAKFAFNNALAAPEIMSYLAEYGYNEARLQRCQERVEKLRQLYQAQRSLYADKLAATATYQEARRKADRHHQNLVRRARILAEETPGVAQALRLSSSDSSKALSNWSARQDQFYARLAHDTALATQLLDYGITEEKLAIGRQAYQATMEAYRARVNLNGLASQATKDRDTAEAELKECLKFFSTIARIALADNPDWLTRLGLA